MIGRCACGAVRYRLTSAPLFVHCCHCRWCQRETGSAFVLNALIEADRVDLLAGAPRDIVLGSESGKGQIISRCESCLVALWSVYSSAGPWIRFVRIGTLEAPQSCPPDIHIYVESKLDWVILEEGVPAEQQFYRRSVRWPADSLARRKKALAEIENPAGKA